LDFIQTDLAENWSLSIDKEQILTGTQGAQDLTTKLLRYLTHTEKRVPILTQLTYDRVLRDMKLELGYDYYPLDQVVGGELDYGFNLLTGMIDLFRLHKETGGSVMYVVNPGGNPSGWSIAEGTLERACEHASEKNGVIVMDAAYLALYFDQEDKYDIGRFKKNIDNGSLMVVRSATKEGGARGSAYLLGDKDRIKKMLAVKSDKELSPIYEVGAKHVLAETATQEDLDELILTMEPILKNSNRREEAQKLLDELESDGIMPMERFRQERIRPSLKDSFRNIKSVFQEVGIELSNPDVDHGYNVICKLPHDANDEQLSAFFEKVAMYGVVATDLSNFKVNEQLYIDHLVQMKVGMKSIGLSLSADLSEQPYNGFRIPFGGYSPEQCKIIALIIARAYKEIFG